MANSQGQIANSKMQWPRAKGQWIGARGKGFHTRNRKKAIKNCEIHENRGFRWQGFRLPDMNCHGSGAKSDLPMPGPKGQPGANCNVQWPGAKGTGAKDFTHPKSKSVKKTLPKFRKPEGFQWQGLPSSMVSFCVFSFFQKGRHPHTNSQQQLRFLIFWTTHHTKNVKITENPALFMTRASFYHAFLLKT